MTHPPSLRLADVIRLSPAERRTDGRTERQPARLDPPAARQSKEERIRGRQGLQPWKTDRSAAAAARSNSNCSSSSSSSSNLFFLRVIFCCWPLLRWPLRRSNWICLMSNRLLWEEYCRRKIRQVSPNARTFLHKETGKLYYCVAFRGKKVPSCSCSRSPLGFPLRLPQPTWSGIATGRWWLFLSIRL